MFRTVAWTEFMRRTFEWSACLFWWMFMCSVCFDGSSTCKCFWVFLLLLFLFGPVNSLSSMILFFSWIILELLFLHLWFFFFFSFFFFFLSKCSFLLSFFFLSKKALGNYGDESILSWKVSINAECSFVHFKLYCRFNFVAIYRYLDVQDPWFFSNISSGFIFLEVYLDWYLCSSSGERLKQFDVIALFLQINLQLLHSTLCVLTSSPFVIAIYYNKLRLCFEWIIGWFVASRKSNLISWNNVEGYLLYFAFVGEGMILYLIVLLHFFFFGASTFSTFAGTLEHQIFYSWC